MDFDEIFRECAEWAKEEVKGKRKRIYIAPLLKYLTLESDRISATATVSAPKLLKMSFGPVSVSAMRVSANLRLRPKLGTGFGRRPNV